MKNFQDLMAKILANGRKNDNDRTGVGRIRIFGNMLEFDMKDDAFPLVTTRAINLNTVLAETLWFIAGETNNTKLVEKGCNIWTPWAATLPAVKSYVDKLIDRKIIGLTDSKVIMDSVPDEIIGEIGPMYGANWRYWPRHTEHIRKEEVARKVEDMPSDFVKQMKVAYEGFKAELLAAGETHVPYTEDEFIKSNYYSHIDQLGELIFNLKSDPFGSRHIVTAYDPSFNPLPGFTPAENVIAGKGALMPCHYAFQVFVEPSPEEGGKPLISLMFHMRSWDVYLGGPFNIAGYGLILKMLAHCLDFEIDRLIVCSGDTHIYYNQVDAVNLQLSRDPRPAPKLFLNPEKKDFFAFTMDDFRLEGYDPHPGIKPPAPAV